MPKAKLTAEADSTVMIEVPIAEPPNPAVFLTDYVAVRLDRPQRTALRRIYDGLIQQGARLATGKPVRRPVDVVRFMLDQVGKT